MTLGEQLKSLRATAGKSQAAIAGGIGICIPYYQRLEHGDQSPSAGMLKRIADFFKVPVSYFTCTAVTAPPVLPEPEAQPITLGVETQPTPTAAKPIKFRTNDGYVCTEEYCEYRRRVDDTYYCPFGGNGCMKT